VCALPALSAKVPHVLTLVGVDVMLELFENAAPDPQHMVLLSLIRAHECKFPTEISTTPLDKPLTAVGTQC
jgi:hypothetical protein